MLLKVTCRIQALLEFRAGSCVDLPIVLRPPKDPGEIQLEVDLDRYAILETEGGALRLRRLADVG
ncbi:hypothetical protein [Symbiobacterium terraclitae]|uniref:hypothetical protein n=1 Tax=Symbiobacterium terraclitae TaxID=557451 RepID=UPI0035B52A47